MRFKTFMASVRYNNVKIVKNVDNINRIVLCSHIGVGIVADCDVLGLGVGLLLPLDVDDLVLGEQSVTHPVKRHPPGPGQQDKKCKGCNDK